MLLGFGIKVNNNKKNIIFNACWALITLSGISMPAAYSEHLRWRVVWHKFLLMKSDEEIACELFLSPRTVMRICHNFVMTGSVLAYKDGRPVGTTTLHQHEEYILLEAIVNEPATRLHQLATTIKEQTGSEFDISTLCRALHRLGFTNKKVSEIQSCN